MLSSTLDALFEEKKQMPPSLKRKIVMPRQTTLDRYRNESPKRKKQKLSLYGHAELEAEAEDDDLDNDDSDLEDMTEEDRQFLAEEGSVEYYDGHVSEDEPPPLPYTQLSASDFIRAWQHSSHPEDRAWWNTHRTCLLELEKPARNQSFIESLPTDVEPLHIFISAFFERRQKR